MFTILTECFIINYTLQLLYINTPIVNYLNNDTIINYIIASHLQ